MFSRDKLSNTDIQEMFQKYMDGCKVKDLLLEYQMPHTTFTRMRNEYKIPSNKKYELHYNNEMQQKFNETFADSINKNYVINISNHKQNLKKNIDQDYFNAIDSSNKAYILGLLYSDGCLHKRNRVCTLALQERDKSILEKINIEMQNESKISLIPNNIKNKNQQNQYCIYMYGRQIYESLIMHGCHPAKSLTLDFPCNLPMELYKDFMRGMLDGDGCIRYYENNSCIKVSLVSTPQFCEKAMLLIETILKINCYIIKNKRAETNVELYISGKNQVLKFLDWIYKDAELYIDRKYEKYLSLKNTNNSLSA